MFREYYDAHKAEDIFSHMEDILQFGAYVMEIQSGTVRWSKGMYQLLGLEPYSEPASTELFYRHIDKPDYEPVMKAIQESMRTKSPYKIELSITTASGEHRRIYAENYMRFDEAGELLEYSGIIKDITENHHYKKALEVKIEELNKSNENLQEFVYIASHDLQEPLRKVSTFLDRFNQKFAETLENEEARDYIRRSLSAVKNMQTLLEDLLSFSRVTFDKKEPVSISLDKIICDVLDDLEIKIEETRTTIDCFNLPELRVYPAQMRQLFNNLINNSIKFARKNIDPYIWITSTKAGYKDYPDLPLRKDTKYHVIVVKDNGIGFEHEYSKQIFKLFHRLHGKAEYSGSGIGLSICKKIMDNHNGFIIAEGTPGHGAAFTMFFPEERIG